MRRVSISPSRSSKGRDQPWRADPTGFGGGRSCGHRSHSVPQCPRGRRYLGAALLALYPGVDVKGAARRESANGLAMMTSLKGASNDDRREEDGQAEGKDRTCHWRDKWNWSFHREGLRGRRGIRLHHPSGWEGVSFRGQEHRRKRQRGARRSSLKRWPWQTSLPAHTVARLYR